MSDVKTIEVEAGGIRFTALEQGKGPLMLCLHGFPDDATSWKAQMPAFAAAGYRVVAPYMRGYAPTSPSPRGCYQTAALGRDVVALIDALSPDGKAVVYGHDWGALAAFSAALLAPTKISRLVTAAVPYGPRFQTAFLTDYPQQKRSWYVFFFQTPMADMAVAHDDFRFIRSLWQDWSPTWHFREDDLGPVLATFRRPGVLEAALGYYRALFNPALHDPELAAEQMRFGLEPISVETLYIHGYDDGCMGVDLVEGMEAAFSGGYTKALIPGAGHFTHREKPDVVNSEVLKFLRK